MRESAKSVTELYQALRPLILRDVGAGGAAAIAASAGAMALHDLAGPYHTGTLLESQAPWAASKAEWNAALASHVALPDVHHAQSHVLATSAGLGADHTVNGLTAGHVLRASSASSAAFAQLAHSELSGITANQHHNQQHSITGSDHTIAASALQVVGATATNTLGLLTPNAAPGAATAILKSDATGKLTLPLFEATTHIKAPLLTTASGDLTIDPVGVVKFPVEQTLKTTTFNSDYPIQGWQINENVTIAGRSALTIGQIQADELHVKIFVADETRVDRGDEYWTKSYGIVATTFTSPSAIGGTVTATFEDSPAVTGAIFTSGDWLLFRQVDIDTGFNTVEIWGQVTSYTDLADGLQSWTFTLRQGATSEEIRAGSLAIDFGAANTNAALIHLSTIDIAGAPYIKMRRWTGANPYTPANYTTYVQIGHLGGVSAASLPYTPSGYGLYIRSGTGAGQAILADDTGLLIQGADFRMYNGINQTVNISSTGTSFWVGLSSSDKRLEWNGSTLSVVGAITANTGYIGTASLGWAIGTGQLTSTNIGLYAGAANSVARVEVGTGAAAVTAGINTPTATGNTVFWAGQTFASRDTAPFRVTAGGALYATAGTIAGNFEVTGSGKLTASDGGIVLTSTGINVGLYNNLDPTAAPSDAEKAINWYVDPSTPGTSQARMYVAHSGSGVNPYWQVVVDPANSGPSIALWQGGGGVKSLWFQNLTQVVGLPGLTLATGTPNTVTVLTGARLALESGSTFVASAHLEAGTNNTYDLGTAGVKWRKIYVGEIIADTVSGGEALGGNTWQRADAGDMYIYSYEEATNRTLYVANPGTGTMSLNVEGNITLGGTVDSVDIALFKSAYDSHAGDTSIHHARSHAITSTSDHTATGLTTGHVLRASGTTTFAWAQLAHSDLSGDGTYSHSTIDSHIDATAAHGATGAVVGTTNTQTLTNKTLTTPTIASFTNAQHAHTNAASGGTISHGSLTGVTADQHHAQQHSITGADHTITASALQVVGATATNTLGLLTPSSDPGVAAAILASDASGGLTVRKLTIKGDRATPGVLQLRSLTNDSSWAAGDQHGAIEFYSSDTSNLGAGVKASIRAYVPSGTTVNGAVSGLAFHTTSTFGSNDMVKMTIDHSGNVVMLGNLTVDMAITGGADILATGFGHFKGWNIGGATGAGMDIGVNAGIGTMIAYDRTGSVYLPMAIQTNNTRQIHLSVDGNMGFFTTATEPWHASYRGLQLGALGSIMTAPAFGAGTGFFLIYNAYYDGAWKYQNSNPAASYRMSNVGHAWQTAPTGIADATTTMTSVMTLDLSGNLTVVGSVDAAVQFLGQAADTISAPSFSWTGDTNTGMFRPAADAIGFTAGGAEKIRITTSGMAVTRTTATPSIVASSVSGGYMIIDSAGGQAALNYYTADNVLLAYGGGKVGIGVTPTVGQLEIAAPASTPGIVINRANSTPSIKAGATDQYLILDSSGGQIRLNAFVTDHVLLAYGGGNVGIGSSTPATKLDVSGDIQTTGFGHFKGWNAGGATGLGVDIGITGGVGYVFAYDRTALAYGNLHLVSASGKGVYLIGSYVGVHDTTPSYPLDVTGDIRTTGSLYVDGGMVDFGTNYFDEATDLELRGTKSLSLFQTIKAASWNITTTGTGTFVDVVSPSVRAGTSTELVIGAGADIQLNPTGVVKLANNKLIRSASFLSGWAGNGWSIQQAATTTAEFDDLTVRGTMRVYELLIQQIRATNGSIYVTSAAKLASATLVSGSTYRCVVDADTADYQPFAVGDVIRAQRVNLQAAAVAAGSGTVVWRSDLTVTAINTGSAPTERTFDATLRSGTTVPAAGMEFVRIGSSVAARQGSIYLTADDSGAPFIDVVNGITSHADWNTAGKVKARFGKLDGLGRGNTDEYGLWAGSGVDHDERSIVASNFGVELNGVPLKFKAGSSTVVMQLDPGAGNASPSIAMGTALPTGPLVGNGLWMGKDGADYEFRVGTVSGGALVSGMHWNGTSLNIVGNTIIGPGSGFTTTALAHMKFDAPTSNPYRINLNTHLGQYPIAFAGSYRGDTGRFGGGLQLRPAGTNYILNPSFETGVANWSAYSAGVATQVVGGVSGDYCCSFATGASSNPYLYSGDTLTMTTGQVWVFSAYVKAGNAQSVGNTVTLNLREQPANVLTSANFTLTAEWQRVSVSRTLTHAAPTSLNFWLVFNSTGGSGDVLLIDAVQLEPGILCGYIDGSMDGVTWTSTAHASASTQASNSQIVYSKSILPQDPTNGTVMLWVKQDFVSSSSAYSSVFRYSGTSSNIIIRSRASDSLWQVYWGNIAISASGTVDYTGQWQHIAVTRSGGTTRLYVDGVQRNNGAGTELTYGSSNVNLGYSAEAGNAVVDEVTILDRALSADEIAQIYQSGQPLNVPVSNNELSVTSSGLSNIRLNTLGLVAYNDLGDESFAIANGALTWGTRYSGGSALASGDVVLGDPDQYHMMFDASASTLLVGKGANEHILSSANGIEIKNGATVYTKLAAGVLTLGNTAAEHVVVDTTGVTLNDAGVTYGKFAATTTIGSTDLEHVLIDSTGVSLKDAGVVYGKFATTTTIGSTSLEHVSIGSTGVLLKDGGTTYGQFAATTIIGSTATEHVSITSSTMQFKDGVTNVYTELTGGVLTLGLVSGGEYMTIDGTNGLRLYSAATLLGQWTAAGGVVIGEVAASKGNVAITAGAVSVRLNTTERIGLTAAGVLTVKDSGGAAVFTLDAAAGAEFTKPLTIGTSGGIYQGTGTFTWPTTGIKFWNDGGFGRIAGYNGAIIQWHAGTDGRLYAGGGNVKLDANGLSVNSDTGGFGTTKALTFTDGGSRHSGIFSANSDVGGASLSIQNNWDGSAAKYTDRHSYLDMSTFAGGTKEAQAMLLASHSGGDLAKIFAWASPSTSQIELYADSIYVDSNLLLKEQASAPSSPTSGMQARLYMKADKLIIQYNDGGTTRYKYIALNDTSTTWTHTTTAP